MKVRCREYRVKMCAKCVKEEYEEELCGTTENERQRQLLAVDAVFKTPQNVLPRAGLFSLFCPLFAGKSGEAESHASRI